MQRQSKRRPHTVAKRYIYSTLCAPWALPKRTRCNLHHHESPEECHIVPVELEFLLDQVAAAGGGFEGLASKNSTVCVVVLFGSVLSQGQLARRSSPKAYRVKLILPLAHIKGRALLLLVFRLKVAAKRLINVRTSGSHQTHLEHLVSAARVGERVIVLDATLLEVDHSADPVRVAMVDWDQQFVQCKDVELQLSRERRDRTSGLPSWSNEPAWTRHILMTAFRKRRCSGNTAAVRLLWLGC